MTWVEHHHRDQALHAVTELADRRRDGLLPWDEIADAEAAFGSPADLLTTLQMRWYTRLSGAIESVLGDQPADLEQGVVHAWRYSAADLPGIRAILDANLDHPAIYSKWAENCGTTVGSQACRMVTGNLINQNFLVVEGSKTCPADVVATPASGDLVNTNTRQHQP